MKKATLASLLLIGASISAEAVTLHRWPLDYYAPTTYSRWFDHDSRIGYMRRYDGNSIFRSFDDGHNGTDILGNVSPTYIRAGASGTLYYAITNCPNNGFSGSTCGGSYGNHVRIQHPDGKVTIYAHMLANWSGYTGAYTCGQAVGIMGNSGNSTGTHLHLEMWSDKFISQRIDHFGGSYSNSGLSYWVSQNGTTAPVYPSRACQ